MAAKVDFHVKEDNTRPYLRVTLKDQDEVVINLTTANAVLFSMEPRDGTIKVNRAACTIVDATNGIVEYRWAAVDTDTPAIYFGEFIVDWDGAGDEITVPNDSYTIIKVKEKVA